MPSKSAARELLIPPSVSLRTLRDAHGLTLPALVKRIAEQGHTVTADHLSHCEIGSRRPSSVLLHAWARALNVPPLDVRPAMDPPLTQPVRVSA